MDGGVANERYRLFGVWVARTGPRWGLLMHQAGRWGLRRCIWALGSLAWLNEHSQGETGVATHLECFRRHCRVDSLAGVARQCVS